MLQDYISDVWSEIDDILSLDDKSMFSAAELRMMILSAFQSKADAFGIDRAQIGLPVEDADTLFVQQASK